MFTIIQSTRFNVLFSGLCFGALLSSSAQADVVIDSTKATSKVHVQGGGGATPVVADAEDIKVTFNGNAVTSVALDTGVQDAHDGTGAVRGTGRGQGVATASSTISGTTLNGIGSATAHFEATPDLGTGQSIDNASFKVEFRVVGTPVNYTLVANLNNQFTSPDQIQLRRMDFGPLGSPVVLCNDFSPNVNVTGTLQPGDYRLVGNIAASESGGSAQTPGDETVDYDYSLSFDAGTLISFSPLPPPAVEYCFGDGNGTPCPCNNDNDGSLLGGQAGCANGSSAGGASLRASGTQSLIANDLVLSAEGLVPNQPGLFFQGLNRTNQGNGDPFGDGLRCAGGAVIRLKVSVANASGMADSGSSSISQLGNVSICDVRRYQFWYRDPAGSLCGNGFNLTNAIEVVWLP